MLPFLIRHENEAHGSLGSIATPTSGSPGICLASQKGSLKKYL